MADEPKELQCIDWRRCFLFLEILRSFRMAIHPGKMLLCLVGLAASVGVGVLVDQIPVVGQTDVRVPGINPEKYDLAQLGIMGPRVSFYENVHYIATKTLWGPWPGGDPATRVIEPVARQGGWVGMVLSPLAAARDSIVLVVHYWLKAPWFALICTVLWLAIWAVVGGAVTRMAAVRVAREESVPLKKAVGFALEKWPSTVTSPLIPFGVLVLVAILVGVFAGLPLMVPYIGEFVVGIFWILALLAGLLLALVFVGGTFSLGLQWPTIAAEGSDSFDAISRSISYITSRPWRYVFYTGFAAIYGCLSFVFIKFLTFLTLRITYTAVSLFTWGGGGADDKLARLWKMPELADPWTTAGNLAQYWGEPYAMYLFKFWVFVVFGVMAAFLVSFFFTSQTVIYFLLRKVVDATDMEEVYMEEAEEESLPLTPKAEGPQAVKIEEQAVPPKPPETPPPSP